MVHKVLDTNAAPDVRCARELPVATAMLWTVHARDDAAKRASRILRVAKSPSDLACVRSVSAPTRCSANCSGGSRRTPARGGKARASAPACPCRRLRCAPRRERKRERRTTNRTRRGAREASAPRAHDERVLAKKKTTLASYTCACAIPWHDHGCSTALPARGFSALRDRGARRSCVHSEAPARGGTMAGHVATARARKQSKEQGGGRGETRWLTKGDAARCPVVVVVASAWRLSSSSSSPPRHLPSPSRPSSSQPARRLLLLSSPSLPSSSAWVAVRRWKGEIAQWLGFAETTTQGFIVGEGSQFAEWTAGGPRRTRGAHRRKLRLGSRRGAALGTTSSVRLMPGKILEPRRL